MFPKTKASSFKYVEIKSGGIMNSGDPINEKDRMTITIPISALFKKTPDIITKRIKIIEMIFIFPLSFNLLLSNIVFL